MMRSIGRTAQRTYYGIHRGVFPSAIIDGHTVLLVVVLVPTPGEKKANDGTHAESDGHHWVGIVAHDLIRGFDAVECFVSNVAIDFFATFERAGEAFARFGNFFSGHFRRRY